MCRRQQHGTPEESRRRIFLLSPASTGGKRADLLLRPQAQFDLAIRLRRGTATLGEAYAFISGLYFRAKLIYSEAFSAPPPGIPGAFIITAGKGLVAPDTLINVEYLAQTALVPIDAANPEYREPLERDCRILDQYAGPLCDFVLLGSVATHKYSAPLTGIFCQRLLFPEEFAGRGDMSRGGLMLRCAQSRTQLSYVPVGEVTRHGPRPPKLPRIPR
jgi:hypothetical protein